MRHTVKTALVSACSAAVLAVSSTSSGHVGQLQYNLFVQDETPGVRNIVPPGYVKLYVTISDRSTSGYTLNIETRLLARMPLIDRIKFQFLGGRPYETTIAYHNGRVVHFNPPIPSLCRLHSFASTVTSTKDAITNRYIIHVRTTSPDAGSPQSHNWFDGHNVAGVVTFGSQDPRHVAFTAWCTRMLARFVNLDVYRDYSLTKESLTISLPHSSMRHRNVQLPRLPLGFLIRAALDGIDSR